MAADQNKPHFLLVTFPAQGSINPTLQFAKRLIRLGSRVTFLTTVSARITTVSAQLLSFQTFSDGYDDGFIPGVDDYDHYISEMRRQGSQTIADLIVSNQNEGRPFHLLVYTLLLPWASEAARELHLPSAMLLIQPAAVLDIYFYYFYGYTDAIENAASGGGAVELPGLPVAFTAGDLPSFLVRTKPDIFNINFKLAFQEQMELLNEDPNPTILVNTFDDLEPEALNAIEKFKMVAVGPLLPSAFLGGKDPTDNSFGSDFFKNLKSSDYIEWLNSKSESSVIYVSFGSIAELSKIQTEELARGLIDTGRPFLWVIREKQNKTEEDELVISCREELERHGMIIPWCSQVQVLSHPSIGCFVTHCGWNSSLETLVSGVPIVAFPQWSDQGTNAKLFEDVWKTGVRVIRNEDGIVEGGEIKRCLDLVMGEEDKALDFRKNARKWKGLAREAVVEGGSSDQNLKAFIAELQLGVH